MIGLLILETNTTVESYIILKRKPDWFLVIPVVEQYRIPPHVAVKNNEKY